MNARRLRGARHIIGPITPAVRPISAATGHPVAYHAPKASTAPRPNMARVSFVEDDSSIRAARDRNWRSRACFSRTGRFCEPRTTANRPTPTSAPNRTAASGTMAAYPARSTGARPGVGASGAAGRAWAGPR